MRNTLQNQCCQTPYVIYEYFRPLRAKVEGKKRKVKNPKLLPTSFQSVTLSQFGLKIPCKGLTQVCKFCFHSLCTQAGCTIIITDTKQSGPHVQSAAETFQMTRRCQSTASYLTLSIDADVQGVSLTPGAVYDGGRALRVEVIALCQAVQCTGLHTTWFEWNTHNRYLWSSACPRTTDSMTLNNTDINDKQHIANIPGYAASPRISS